MATDSLLYQPNEPQARIHACLLSRHHDGHLRQRQIERLAGVSQSWVVLFLVQLCGEYVVEILQEIEACMPLLDRRV